MSAAERNPYLDPQRVRAALRALDLRPTRAMGQNFLVDAAALDQIVAAAELGPDDRVVEVGPGIGVLTWELVRRAGHVVAVELDRRLAERLRGEFPPGALTIIQGDVLKLTPHELVAAPPYKLVANLPYAITAPLLRHFLEATPAPELMVILVQWEVAQRITAAPGGLSVLAHAVQLYAEPEIVARIGSASFLPTPAVDSALLRLRRRAQPAVDIEPTALFRVIKAGFLQPRKKLSNALAGGLAAFGSPIPREQAIAALETAGINPDRRAETVTLAEWTALCRVLAAMND